MNIAIISEIGNFTKYPRNFENARTDVAWSIALDAVSVPADSHLIKKYIESFTSFKKFDLAIIIPGKNKPYLEINFIREYFADKVTMMQEGPNWYWQDYDIKGQFNFYNALRECDFILCHNSADKKYYKGITNLECLVMPSLMIEDTIKNVVPKRRDAEGIVIGGNFCSWYGGMDSFIVSASSRKEWSTGYNLIPVFAPSMGRKKEDEDYIPDITHLPYCSWMEWINQLASKAKIGVHLMRTHAAGTFALNCSFLGIPCVGYEGLDTQDNLHPYTTVRLGNTSQAVDIIKKLANPGFYEMCSEESKHLYDSLYSESAFKNRFINKLNNLVNEN